MSLVQIYLDAVTHQVITSEELAYVAGNHDGFDRTGEAHCSTRAPDQKRQHQRHHARFPMDPMPDGPSTSPDSRFAACEPCSCLRMTPPDSVLMTPSCILPPTSTAVLSDASEASSARWRR